MAELSRDIYEAMRAKGFSPSDIEAAASKRGLAVPPPQKTALQSAGSTLGEEIGSGLRDIVYQPKAAESIRRGVDEFSGGHPFKGAFDVGAGIAGAGFQAAGGALRAAASPVTATISGLGTGVGNATGLSDEARHMMERIAETKAAQDVVATSERFGQEQPGASAIAGGVSDIGMNLPLIRSAGKVFGNIGKRAAEVSGKRSAALTEKIAAEQSTKQAQDVLSLVGPGTGSELGAQKTGEAIITEATRSGKAPFKQSVFGKVLGKADITDATANKELSNISRVYAGRLSTGVTATLDKRTKEVGKVISDIDAKRKSIANESKLSRSFEQRSTEKRAALFRGERFRSMLREDTDGIGFAAATEAEETLAEKRINQFADEMERILRERVDKSLTEGEKLTGKQLDEAVTEFNNSVRKKYPKAFEGGRTSMTEQAANVIRKNARTYLAENILDNGAAYKQAAMDEYWAIRGRGHFAKRFAKDIGRGTLEGVGKATRPLNVAGGAAAGLAFGLGISTALPVMVQTAIAATLVGAPIALAARKQARKAVFDAIQKTGAAMQKAAPEEKLRLAEELLAATRVLTILQEKEDGDTTETR